MVEALGQINDELKIHYCELCVSSRGRIEFLTIQFD